MNQAATPLWPAIDDAVAGSLGRPFSTRERTPISGGCINSAAVISSGHDKFFVKLNSVSRLAMFEAEAEGLAALAASRAVRVPSVVCAGSAGQQAFLVLEYLDLGSPAPRTAGLLGLQLAELHARKQAYFGWTRDNTIGATPQPNDPSANWPEFFRRHRLGHQLSLARRAQGNTDGIQSKGARLCDRLNDFFSGHDIYPSLLHGDLWGGNFAATPDGDPVIFDPAVYFGDRETDIAMTELFGGFDSEFYQAYAAALPLDTGYAVRRNLYKLYHVLNHLNLFGGGYAAQAERLMDALLAELG